MKVQHFMALVSVTGDYSAGTKLLNRLTDQLCNIAYSHAASKAKQTRTKEKSLFLPPA